jgi:hypothetical protein
MNSWLVGHGASGVTIAGDFVSITFNPIYNLPADLNGAWNAGFVPFVNLSPSATWESTYGYYDAGCATAAAIAAGSCDAKISAIADAFKQWAVGGRRAYLAPMPEMNSDWVSYGTGNAPASFISAYKRMQLIFSQRGVPASTVQWVFVPNGWNDVTKPTQAFEYYYPGDDAVDVVAFSAYNYGGCPDNWKVWDTFETAMQPYLARMRIMAPTKPIFIAQTGTVNVPNNPANALTTENKSYWVQDTFRKLANYPAVRAIVYFNIAPKIQEATTSCPTGIDYQIYSGGVGGSGEPGFLSIMSDSLFGKWANSDTRWANVAFARPAYSFSDVLPSHPFSGVANIWYFDSVEKTKAHGVTTGCAQSPARYCPNDMTSRAQMAVFLLRAIHGGSYAPPAVGTSSGFSDVPIGHWAAAWIKEFAIEGLTSGCGSGNYCPEAAVKRAEMAKFLLLAKYGSSYAPPSAGANTGFSDVSSGYWAANWIKQLAADAITTGCGGGKFCPDATVSRAEMAAFLTRTFGW